MYAHIEGIVAEKTKDAIVLDAGGVGYLLFVSGAALSQAPQAGGRMKLYTVLSVREDAMDLYGFYSKEEKALFEKLRSVSGVGPRTALAVLSSLSVRELNLALVAGDANALTKAPGVGKKMAQRLIMELKDKIGDEDLTASGASVSAVSSSQGPEGEAVVALIALGYSSQEAAQAVSRVAGEGGSANDLIFKALKSLGS